MSKRQEIRARRRKEKQQRKMITLGSIIIGAGLIAAVLIYSSAQQVSVEFSSRFMAEDNAMGNPDAPIKIVEYSDYKCGHCGSFTFETEPILEEEYIKTGDVYFVYRSVGGMLSGAEPLLGAEASYCAGEQNMFWEMHDVIFANQASPFSNTTMNKWAKTIGADVDAFKACMSENKYVERANQDEADAKAAGISGTPSFVISYLVDGELVEQLLPGNYPIDAFRQVIDEGLAATGN
ncbi:MAG: thioredoxin domain-containing protein [Anaerolineae bacterium]|jgi:protein-disulfide isomerase|nr:thioredoxin domain-containing protein [Anaerolineae bacterium]MBT7075543.1 thioredoxin domain-containing protein [Anaerolineae bacterium]MBT7783792.1 thioredoxin domain-containing protein [Anaerolineae bacterium]